MQLSSTSPSSYFLLDSVLILTLFGCFGSLHFDTHTVHENLNSSSGYSFKTSPLDFLVLSFLRFTIFLLSYHLNSMGKSKSIGWFDKPVAIFCVSSVSFSFLKFLVYSEQNGFVQFAGVWLLPLWNVISSAVFYKIWTSEFESCFEKKKIDEEDEEDPDIPLTKKEQILILLRYSIENWPWLLFGTSITFATATVQVAIPHYQSAVINGITSMVESDEIVSNIKTLTVLTLLSMVITGARGGSFQYLTSLTISKMRRDLFDAVIQQEVAFFDKYKSGELVSRLTSDVDRIANRLENICNYSLRIFLTLIGKVIFMVSISWRLSMVNFVAFPIIIYVTKLTGDFYDVLGDDSAKATADAHTVAEEMVSTIRTVRSFAAERNASKKFGDAIRKAERISKKESLAVMASHFSYDLYYNFIYVMVLLYGAHLFAAGKIEAASLVAFMMYQLQVGDHIEDLNWAIPDFMSTLGKSRKFCQFLVRKPRISNDGKIEETVKGELEIDGVSFKYPNRPNNQVLKDLSLTIRSGETLALVGPSGGGKSTIVSLLERFYNPEEGEIKLDGVPLKDYDHEYYHRKIALVAQEPVLYDCSVRDNIGFGCNVSEEEIVEAAKTANAHNFVMGLEKGYETSCGEKGAQMSGGQKQRIAIARALVRNPSILILDEATSALDNQSEQIVQEAMQRCSSNRTVIVIAHRLSTIEKADRIAVIDKGRVVQLGTHNELLKDKEGLYHTLVHSKNQET